VFTITENYRDDRGTAGIVLGVRISASFQKKNSQCRGSVMVRIPPHVSDRVRSTGWC